MKSTIAIIISIVIVVTTVSVFKPSNYNMKKHSVAYFNTIDNEYVILFNDKKPIIIDEDILEISENLTETAVAYITDDNVLCFIKNNDTSPTEIADDVVHFSFSDDGKNIYYAVETGENEEKYESSSRNNYDSNYDSDYVSYYDDDDEIAQDVYDLYTCKLGKSPKLVDNDVCNYVCSPNGKTFIYLKGDDYYVKKGKKETQLDISEKSRIYSVSNGGKYIYYSKSSSIYVMKNKKDVTKLGDSLLGYNKSMDEVLYRKDDDIYISVKGKEGEKIINSAYDIYGLISPKYSYGSPKTFVNGIISTGKGLYKIGKTRDKTTKIASDYNGVSMSSDGKKLVCYDPDGLYRISDFDKPLEEKDSLNQDIEIFSLAMSTNAKKIYFCDEDDDLYYIKNNNSPKRISSDVTEVKNGLNNKTFFVVKDDELFYSKNGSDLSAVKGIDGDVYSIISDYKMVICVTDEAVYRCTSGTKFEHVFDTK
jgi:hypothetical protein